MIPKPPFPWELSEEQERESFDALKAQLVRFWSLNFPDDDRPYTTVVVPSLTLDAGELAKIRGGSFLEERLLFLLMRLRNPWARLVYVTSLPLHPLVLEYYLQLLVGVTASHARARLTLLCAYDASPKPLTQKILERPRLIERIRASVPDREQAYLTTFNSTPLERRLAVLLGIPLNGADPDLVHLGSKSGSRRIFREAGVELPAGVEGVRTESDVLAALNELKRREPGLDGALIKLDQSFSGEGNALVTLRGPGKVDEACLDELCFAVTDETRSRYFDKLARMGGVVEELVIGEDSSSPSVQMRINPTGRVFVASTHEQILGGPTGQVYKGCRFPAREPYRLRLQEAGLRIGEVLARCGVTGRFSVDFIVRRYGQSWDAKALEINLRMGGTTHTMLALRFLTGGSLDPATGLFTVADGCRKFYRASDNLESPDYEGLIPEDLVDILVTHGLAFSHRTLTGVLFHMIGAISQFGKVGLVAIGDSPEEAESLYQRVVSVLDRETLTPAPQSLG
jgi:hypothetical protein